MRDKKLYRYEIRLPREMHQKLEEVREATKKKGKKPSLNRIINLVLEEYFEMNKKT